MHAFQVRAVSLNDVIDLICIFKDIIYLVATSDSQGRALLDGLVGFIRPHIVAYTAETGELVYKPSDHDNAEKMARVL